MNTLAISFIKRYCGSFFMRKIMKDLLKIVPITIFLFASFHFLGALLLYKNGFDYGIYYYFALAIQLCIAAIAAFIFHNSESAYYGVIPLILTDIVLIAVYRSFHIKTAILMICTILIYYIIILLFKKKPSHKKRNINAIRRDYEKIRKKQYHKH